MYDKLKYDLQRVTVFPIHAKLEANGLRKPNNEREK